MKPQQRLFRLFLALIAPALFVTIYLLMQYPRNQAPAWIPVGFGFYVLSMIVVMTLYGRRIAGAPAPPADAANSQNAPAPMRGAIVLIAMWSGLFLYGTLKFVKGEIPAERALPAGALLLAFIVVFGFFLWRDVKARWTSGR